mmetsp:Transcript_50713/g.164021  ORF Transcript_50713/g.164021 Transcript_50713/m.164021 type:complete len:85 (+) Transcript_50713:246-500(+)
MHLRKQYGERCKKEQLKKQMFSCFMLQGTLHCADTLQHRTDVQMKFSEYAALLPGDPAHLFTSDGESTAQLAVSDVAVSTSRGV